MHEDLLTTGTNIVSVKISPSLTLTIVAAQTEGIQGNLGMERTPRHRHVRTFISVPLLIEDLRRQGG